MTVSMESALKSLWDEAKDSPDYDEGHWLAFQMALELLETELSRCHAELARYRTVASLVKEIMMERDENVPRGTK